MLVVPAFVRGKPNRPAPDAAGVEFIDENGGSLGVRLRMPAKDKPRK